MGGLERTQQSVDPRVSGDETIAAVPTGRARAGLKSGDSVGRYVVLHRLGAGAMGEVYAAYDPDLDRRVAIKVLRAEPDADGSSDQRQLQLQKEAQSLAKLAHPNVVAVYDVGVHEVAGGAPEVFLAMEFVAGSTLSDWVARARPSWREVLRVLTAAGSGVAAAHDAGVVHRDLKPDNVMLGDDGRVRVMDFGLADSGARHPHRRDVTDGGDEQPQTHAGLVGTPAYMAPEGFAGGGGTRYSDQFSYCVMLWEALYGQRPFAGKTLPELSTNVCGGRIESPRDERGVPSWLRTVVERGLSVDETQRHPSMAALVSALRRGEGTRRRRQVGAAVAIVAVVGFGLGAWQRARVVRSEQTCRDDARSVATWWESERDALRKTLADSEASYARFTSEAVSRRVDEWVERFVDGRAQRCTAPGVLTVVAPEADATRWCFDAHALELRGLVEVLGQAGTPAIDVALEEVSELADPRQCADAAFATGVSAPPAEQADRALALVQMLARARALAAAGGVDDGLALARRALAEAETLAWPPLVARARVAEGELLSDSSEQAEAERVLSDAYFDADAAGDDETAELAARLLAYLVGHDLARPDDGELWLRLAAAAGQRRGEADAFAAAQREAVAGALAYTRGQYTQARERYQRARASLSELLGAEHPRVATVVMNLASTEFSLGERDQALAGFEHARDMYERIYGENHPTLAGILNNLSAAYRHGGDRATARTYLARAVKLREASQGPRNTRTINTLLNLAILDDELGDTAAARDGIARVYELTRDTVGDSNPFMAHVLTVDGKLHYDAGDLAGARDRLDRAAAMYEATLGPEHVELATTLASLAAVLEAQGELAQAIDATRRSAEIRVVSRGPMHRETTVIREALVRRLRAQAVAEREAGRNDTAEALLREADQAQVAIDEAARIGPEPG